MEMHDYEIIDIQGDYAQLKILDSELDSFNKIREKFNNTKETDKNFSKVSDEFDQQVERVRAARTQSDMKTQIHYLALNEKRNIRKK